MCSVILRRQCRCKGLYAAGEPLVILGCRSPRAAALFGAGRRMRELAWPTTSIRANWTNGRAGPVKLRMERERGREDAGEGIRHSTSSGWFGPRVPSSRPSREIQSRRNLQ